MNLLYFATRHFYCFSATYCWRRCCYYPCRFIVAVVVFNGKLGFISLSSAQLKWPSSTSKRQLRENYYHYPSWPFGPPYSHTMQNIFSSAFRLILGGWNFNDSSWTGRRFRVSVKYAFLLYLRIYITCFNSSFEQSRSF